MSKRGWDTSSTVGQDGVISGNAVTIADAITSAMEPTVSYKKSRTMMLEKDLQAAHYQPLLIIPPSESNHQTQYIPQHPHPHPLDQEHQYLHVESHHHHNDPTRMEIDVLRNEVSQLKTSNQDMQTTLRVMQRQLDEVREWVGSHGGGPSSLRLNRSHGMETDGEQFPGYESHNTTAHVNITTGLAHDPRILVPHQTLWSSSESYWDNY
ncbi:hypothetical protein HDU97_001155 [Phlyctochytrium planicorne]|nr:hypothetical protein HDU97_001155 [Phlyctochytrium planicorne]